MAVSVECCVYYTMPEIRGRALAWDLIASENLHMGKKRGEGIKCEDGGFVVGIVVEEDYIADRGLYGKCEFVGVREGEAAGRPGEEAERRLLLLEYSVQVYSRWESVSLCLF